MICLPRGVIGFSRLEYVEAVAKHCYQNRKAVVTKQELYDVIQETADQLEKKWKRDVRRRSGQKASRGSPIADKCIEALQKWQLIGENFDVKERTLEIGESFSEKKIIFGFEEGKTELLDAILSSKFMASPAEQPFHPSNLWISLRNYETREVQTTFRACPATASKQSDEAREKESKKEETISGPVVSYVGPAGLAFDEEIFVKKVLGTNFFSIDVMRDWGEYFDILYWFPIAEDEMDGQVKLQMEALRKTEKYSRLYLRWPSYGIYLTVLIASLEELMTVRTRVVKTGGLTFSELKDAFGFGDYACRCVVELLVRLGLVSIEEGKMRSLRDDEISSSDLLDMVTDGLVISDGPDVYGVLSKEQIRAMSGRLQCKNCYVVMNPKVSLERFEVALTERYRRMVDDRFGIPVWISELAFAVCRELRISRDAYDELIVNLYEKGRVDLFRAPTRLVKSRMKAARPLEHRDSLFRLISIR